MSNEEFEKWARDNGMSLSPSAFRIGTFSNQGTEMAFRAWQARQPEIDALIHDNTNLYASLQTAEREVSSKDKTIDDLALRSGILKAEVGRLTDCLAKANANLEHTERVLYIKIGDFEDEVGRLESENDALKADVERSWERLVALQTQIDSLTLDNRKLIKVASDYYNELASGKKIINELRVMIQNALTVDRNTPIWEMVKEFERKYGETK